MDYIQILVVHSGGVFNFMGMILEAQVSFIYLFFSRFFAFFSKISFKFLPFSNPTVVKEISIKKALKFKRVCEMNRGIHCKSAWDILYGGWQSVQELASLMRKG